MASIETQIRSAEQAITENIATFNGDRNLLCKNILAHSRNLIEGIAVLIIEKDANAEFHFNKVGPALSRLGYAGKEVNFVYKFHDFLQQSVSHYSPDGDQPERLMLKYFDYFQKTKKLLSDKYNTEIIANLDDFPIRQDPELKEYHEAISAVIETNTFESGSRKASERYYIHSIKPFFVKSKTYYEVTFNGVFSDDKQDRIIAFTNVELTDDYASYLDISTSSVTLNGIEIPINIITDWSVAIRPCEFHKLSRILGLTSKTQSGNVEYKFLMKFLTERSLNLLTIVDMNDDTFNKLRMLSTDGNPKVATYIFDSLASIRTLTSKRSRGGNIVRYLILKMNNLVLENQIEAAPNNILSNMYLKNKCIPFDDMPFCSSLSDHNPQISNLLKCFSASEREDELLARSVKNNSEQHGHLYMPIEELADFKNLNDLIKSFNAKLHRLHKPAREIRSNGKYLYIHQYQEDALAIIDIIKDLSSKKIEAYQESTQDWLDSSPELDVSDPMKQQALLSMFSDSRVALIYGAAGTGKTTLLSLVANRFNEQSILFAAQTNPAVQNLRTKINAKNAEYSTIDRLIYSAPKKYDVLVIDECSTVSNESLIKLLRKTEYKLLILVGDNYQIESIKFGNWFEIIKHFAPKKSIFELTKPWRTNDAGLLSLWSAVRNGDENIDEVISQNDYSAPLSKILEQTSATDEIILCLSYGGLYGVNNVNYLLQHQNPNISVEWGILTFKVNDPVVFTGNVRLNSFIHNNLKGTIARIVKRINDIMFDIQIDKVITDIDPLPYGFSRIDEHTVRFRVLRSNSSDADQPSSEYSVPFKIAYAATIHKAQGLEYKSVKVVVVSSEEESVSLNILYTAITRSTQDLKIYWSSDTQRNVLSNISKTDFAQDAGLLLQSIKLKQNK